MSDKRRSMWMGRPVRSNGNVIGDGSASLSRDPRKVETRVFLKHLIASFHTVNNVDWI